MGCIPEDTRSGAISQPKPGIGIKPVSARNVDEKAIAELGKEREILDRVATFFVVTVKHYRLAPDVLEADEDIDQGGLINANARLMQASGRTLFKIMEVLLKHKKEAKEKGEE